MESNRKNIFSLARFFGAGISGQERVAAMVRSAITIFLVF